MSEHPLVFFTVSLSTLVCRFSSITLPLFSLQWLCHCFLFNYSFLVFSQITLSLLSLSLFSLQWLCHCFLFPCFLFKCPFIAFPVSHPTLDQYDEESAYLAIRAAYAGTTLALIVGIAMTAVTLYKYCSVTLNVSGHERKQKTEEKSRKENRRQQDDRKERSREEEVNEDRWLRKNR